MQADSVNKPSLLALLATLQPLDEEFLEIEDPLVTDHDFSLGHHQR